MKQFANITGEPLGVAAAVYAAQRSTVHRFKTGAALIDCGRVVEIGWSHPGAIRWARTPWSTHAEAHLALRCNFEMRGHLWVATISGQSGALTMSQPCDTCAALLRNLTISPTMIHYYAEGEWQTT